MPEVLPRFTLLIVVRKEELDGVIEQILDLFFFKRLDLLYRSVKQKPFMMSLHISVISIFFVGCSDSAELMPELLPRSRSWLYFGKRSLKASLNRSSKTFSSLSGSICCTAASNKSHLWCLSLCTLQLFQPSPRLCQIIHWQSLRKLQKSLSYVEVFPKHSIKGHQWGHWLTLRYWFLDLAAQVWSQLLPQLFLQISVSLESGRKALFFPWKTQRFNARTTHIIGWYKDVVENRMTASVVAVRLKWNWQEPVSFP